MFNTQKVVKIISKTQSHATSVTSKRMLSDSPSKYKAEMCQDMQSSGSTQDVLTETFICKRAKNHDTLEFQLSKSKHGGKKIRTFTWIKII